MLIGGKDFIFHGFEGCRHLCILTIVTKIAVVRGSLGAFTVTIALENTDKNNKFHMLIQNTKKT
jgi:hypothetical protein